MTDSNDDSFIKDTDLEEFSVPLFLHTAQLQTQFQPHFSEFEKGWEEDLFLGKEHLLYALDNFYDEFIPAYYLGEDFTESKQTEMNNSELQEIFAEREWTSLTEFKLLFFDFLEKVSAELPTEEEAMKEFYSKLEENNYSISYEKFKDFSQNGLPNHVKQQKEKYEKSVETCLLPVSIDEGTVWEGKLVEDDESGIVKVEILDFEPPARTRLKAHLHPYPLVRVVESSHSQYTEDETYKFNIEFFRQESTNRKL